MSQSLLDRLDHAFENMMVVLGILFGTIFQYLAWLWPSDVKEPISAGVTLYLLPLILALLIWILQHTTTDENTRMSMRLFSWVLGLSTLLSYVLIIFMITISPLKSPHSEYSFLFIIIVMIIFCSLVINLYKKIEKIYKIETRHIKYWKYHWYKKGSIIAFIFDISFFIFSLFYINFIS